jgi:hypothetical protein
MFSEKLAKLHFEFDFSSAAGREELLGIFTM